MAGSARIRADHDCYAVDEVGVRRLIKAGDFVPSTWTLEDDDDAPALEHEAKAKAKAKPRGRRAGKRS